MVGLDDNAAVVMGEWLDRSGSSHKKKKRSKSEQVDRGDYLFEEKPRGALALGERIAARSGFNAPSLNTKNILRSPCLTISSPGLSPSTLLESPVFLSNPLPSPTTGKLSSLPSDIGKDKDKDDFFDNIATPLAFQSISRTRTDLDDSQDSTASGDDGYNWRKYGQKLVKGSEYPRSYYKCTHPNCEVKKKIERSREGHITEIIYTGAHNHPKPPPNPRSAMQVDGTQQECFPVTNEHIEWASPVSGSMQVQSETQFGYGDAFSKDNNEEDHKSHMSVSMVYQVDESDPKRRKLEAYATETSGSTRTIREPRVMLQTTSDIDILEDGYRWRKYGQKIVKGNPNPRSYYKCTANGCTVTKHVERASGDSKSVITTYIGKHTHHVPAAPNSSSHVTSGGSNTHQSGLATQTHNLHSLLDFQPHLRPPSDFSVCLGQTELSDCSMPGQEKLPSLPASSIADPTHLMLQLAAEPKVEVPVSQPGLDLSQSSLIYREILSRLPEI